MRFANAVVYLLVIIATLSVHARGSKPDKHPASKARDRLQFAVEVFGVNAGGGWDALVARIEAETGRCAWSMVSQSPYPARLYLGLFDDRTRAMGYGIRLRALGLVSDFRVEPVTDLRGFTRARSVKQKRRPSPEELPASSPPGIEPGSRPGDSPPDPPGGLDELPPLSTPGTENVAFGTLVNPSSFVNPLPFKSLRLDAAERSRADSRLTPRPKPAARAIYELTGKMPNNAKGGLWLSGDVDSAADRLRWIAGDRDSRVVKVDSENKASLDLALLERLAGVAEPDRPETWLKVAGYIYANEGLLLLVQLTSSSARYVLHVGHSAPTAGGDTTIEGTVNLDKRFDSRINPYRKNRVKVPSELPPAGFDSMVALNPAAQWFNLYSKQMVLVAEIAFHELAEALAKVDQGLEYLPSGPFPGAHNTALERERRLKSQRPGSHLVISAGQNILFRSPVELERLTDVQNRFSLK